MRIKTLRFSGNHWLPGMTDESVRSVWVSDISTIPFVIPQLFESFPNVFRFIVFPSGLTRIQSNAFRYARNLELITINSNPLHTIQRNAFVGAGKLRTLDLSSNQIVNIFEDSFSGLSSLRDLMLSNNRIHRLPATILRPLKSVESVLFGNNRIKTIDDQLFYGLRRLREIDFVRNRINEVGKSVFDGLNSLEVFNILGNRCANNLWIVGGGTSIDTIRNGLNNCFMNYDRLRRVRVEIRGKATISDDYGNEIMSW